MAGKIIMNMTKSISGGLIVMLVLSALVTAQNLKPEEIVAKHLNAVGSKESRDAIKTLMAVGQSEFETKVPAIKGGGRALVVSDPANFFFVLSLNSKEYPFEKIGFFDGKQNLPFVSAGKRSLLGTFISEHDKILAGGLFGGNMSLRWALFNVESLKARVSSAGTKTIDGRKAHVLNYFPAGGNSTEFTIKLYFDAETFHHLRSEYRREIPAKAPTFGAANQIASSNLTLTENFSDFKSVDNLTLPFSYRVDFLSNSNAAVYESSWGIKVEQYSFNQKLTPDFFTFDPK